MRNTWETPRLLLRLMGPEHAASVREYGLRSAEYQRPYDPARPRDHWELAVVADRLAAQLRETQTGHSLCLFISAKSDPNRVIGAINLRNIVRGAMLSATLGYGLDPAAVGAGYMTESVNRVADIAFDDLALHRVEANVMPTNRRSLGVVERAGFVREGLSPKYLQIAGRWEDHLRFARVAPDDGWGR